MFTASRWWDIENLEIGERNIVLIRQKVVVEVKRDVLPERICLHNVSRCTCGTENGMEHTMMQFL